MSSGLPERVDPLRSADAQRRFKGSAELQRFERLAGDLAETSGEVVFDLAFGRLATGFAALTGRLTAVVHLRCQRCLEIFPLPLDLAVALGFVETESLAERVPPGYEPCLVEDGTVSVPDIIENELLLALPQVPMHPPEQCRVQLDWGEDDELEEPGAEERPSPFAVLKQLKIDD